MSFLPHSVSQGSYKGLPGFKEKQRRSQLDRRKPASQFKKSKWDRIDIGWPPLEKHHGLQTPMSRAAPMSGAASMSGAAPIVYVILYVRNRGPLFHQRTERLLKADGFHSTDETEKPRLCEPLQPYHSPTLYPISLSHQQPLKGALFTA